MFQKASRTKAPARIALMGPSGSGKSMTALLIMNGLTKGQKFAAIDTERGSLSKYSDSAEFDVCELQSFAPKSYVEAIKAAGNAGYKGLVIDSLSHAWNGKDGALDQVDKAARKSSSNNSYTAWRDVTPQHNDLVDAILQFPGDVIVTMRVKTAYELQENDRGKKTPVKIGLAPIQRDGMEYEFDVVADIYLNHEFVISKTRISTLDGFQANKAGQDVADLINSWKDGAAEAPAKTDPANLSRQNPATQSVGKQQMAHYAKLLADAKTVGITQAEFIANWRTICSGLEIEPNPEKMDAEKFAACQHEQGQWLDERVSADMAQAAAEAPAEAVA